MFCRFLIAALFFVANASAHADHFQLFLLTGQSNSLGTTAGGESDLSPGWDAADEQVRFFWSNVANAESGIGDSAGEWTKLKTQQGGYYPGNATHWGPEFGFARSLSRAGARNLGIIKASRGGGGNSLWSKSNRGHMYQHVVNTVQAATGQLKNEGHTFEIVGLLYLQGESDSLSEARLAGVRLNQFICDLRSELPHAKQMVAVVGGVATAGTVRDLVRAEQQDVAKQRDVHFFSNLDLQDQLYDKLHFNKAAKLVVGHRFANEFIQAGVANPSYGKLVFIGDSITQGSASSLGYRYQVFKQLVDFKARYQFVGSVSGAHDDGSTSQATPVHKGKRFQNIHEGHWGWRASWINGRLPLPTGRRIKNGGEGCLTNWLGLTDTYELDKVGNRIKYPALKNRKSENRKSASAGNVYQPDTAVVMVGINDVADGTPNRQIRDDIATIIDQLRSAKKGVRLFLCEVLYTNQSQQRNELVDSLNLLLEGLARAKSSELSPVFFVRTNSGFQPDAMTYDQVHPNQKGAMLIADNIVSGMGLGGVSKPESPRPSPLTVGKQDKQELDSFLTSFENSPSGEIVSVASEVGVWKAKPGHAKISNTHYRTGKQCLHVLGGADREVELVVRPQKTPPEILSFWSERWTKGTPFVFRVDAFSDGVWQEIYNGDRQVVVGRAFKSFVKIELKKTPEKIRFRCTTPANSGLLIDDLQLKPAIEQQVKSVSMEPLALPALLGNPQVAIGKLLIRCEGSKRPLTLESVKVATSDDNDVIQKIGLVSTLGNSSFRASGPQDYISKQIAIRRDSANLKSKFELTEGDNYFWVVAQLKQDASIDGRVSADCREVIIGGKAFPVTSLKSMLAQRLGVAVRNGGDDGVHTFRIPGLATTTAGTLIGVYDVRYRNGGDLPGDIDVGMSRSVDGGQNWEPMKIIMDMGGDPKWRYDGIGDPAILVDKKTGVIWVAALWSHGNRGWVGSGPGTQPLETGQFVIVRSDDDGRTWSEPINITSQVKQKDWCLLLQGPGKGITMSDGTLVFPAQFQDSLSKRRLPRSTIIYSRDQGASWKVGTGAFDDTTEAQVVELEDGRLMLNCRYNRAGVRVVMTTSDMGETWQPHPTNVKTLIEPGACQASLIDVTRELDLIKPNRDRSNERPLLLFCNPNSPRGRKNMTIKASLDGGETWPVEYQVLLDGEMSGGYSCMSMIDENTVGILYEGSQAHMTFQRIKIIDILGR